jgi:transposase
VDASVKEAREQVTVLRAVRQYSLPLPRETMDFLCGIAEDYARVCNVVYRRYSGIGGLEKLYPGYTIQNEMNSSELRKELNLPYGYFHMAMFEAIGNIKSKWSNLKNRIVFLVKRNKNLTEAERQYIYYILKYDKLYAAVLTGREFERPQRFVDLNIDFRRPDNLIRRLTRRHMPKASRSASTERFRADSRCYRYKDGGIYLASRTAFKRVFIPLTDNAVHDKPITMRLKHDSAELIVAVESAVKPRKDFTNRVALYLGYSVMFTAAGGNDYGERLGEMLAARSDRVYAKRKLRGSCYGSYRKAIQGGNTARAARIKANNLGAHKLQSRNRREMDGIKSYINAEINRMLETEKPREIIIPARSKAFGEHMRRETKQKLSGWTVGYIRKRLSDKCALLGVAIKEVNAAYTSGVCAECGNPGKRMNRTFVCDSCGAREYYPQNSAHNLLKKADGTFKMPAGT